VHLVGLASLIDLACLVSLAGLVGLRPVASLVGLVGPVSLVSLVDLVCLVPLLYLVCLVTLLHLVSLPKHISGVFVTREHVCHNKSGITHRDRAKSNHYFQHNKKPTVHYYVSSLV
jgi:hypothetical protein